MSGLCRQACKSFSSRNVCASHCSTGRLCLKAQDIHLFLPLYFRYVYKRVYTQHHIDTYLSSRLTIPLITAQGLVFNLVGRKGRLIETSTASGELNCDIHRVLIAGHLLLPSVSSLSRHSTTNGLITAKQALFLTPTAHCLAPCCHFCANKHLEQLS